MKFYTGLFLEESKILKMDASDVSYSPLFSTIGLTSPDDFCGIESIFLNYNRASRAIWTPFISFEEGLMRVPSSMDRLCFANDGKKAVIAFYGCDRFMVETENTDCFEICGAPADASEDIWVEAKSEDCVIVRGYSCNSDVRDPDQLVPYMAGVKAIRGSICEKDCKITAKADADGKICIAFVMEALDISKDSIIGKMNQAPGSAEAAAQIAREWFMEMLGDFETEVGGEKEKEILAHAIKGLLFNATLGQGQLGNYVSAYPSRGTYPTHFLWDTCFQNLALEYLNPRLAKDSLLLFAKCQRADGKYAQFLCSTWSRPHEAQPALVGWATMRIVANSAEKDMEFIRTMFESLEKNNNWWLNQRMTRYGVIYCPHGLETGQDDSPRFDNGPVLAVDMNSYLLNQMRATAELAELLGLAPSAAAWNKKADCLAENMIKVLYDAKENMFFDAEAKTGKRQSLWTSSGFLPLWAGVDIGKEKASCMIKTHMLDEKRFFGKIPFPCVAYDQEAYQPEKWWRGPAWMSLDWLMLETLEKYGFKEAHAKVCRTYYEMILNDGQLRELFNSQTGEGLGAYDQGWTAAVFVKLNKILCG